jgi:hypothetical protein
MSSGSTFECLERHRAPVTSSTLSTCARRSVLQRMKCPLPSQLPPPLPHLHPHLVSVLLSFTCNHIYKHANPRRTRSSTMVYDLLCYRPGCCRRQTPPLPLRRAKRSPRSLRPIEHSSIPPTILHLQNCILHSSYYIPLTIVHAKPALAWLNKPDCDAHSLQTSNAGWHRVGSDIVYFCSKVHRSGNGSGYHTLSFTIQMPYTGLC